MRGIRNPDVLMRVFFVLLTLFYAFGISGKAQSPKNNKSNLAGLHYLFRPATGPEKKVPLLIMLHGYGSNEGDLFSLTRGIDPRFLVIALRAPLKINQTGYAWFNINFNESPPAFDEKQAENSMKQIIEFVKEVQKIYPIDSKQIFLLGFSQGASLSLSLCLQNPGLFKGAAVLSGREMKSFTKKYKPASELKSLHFFVSHGTEDKIISIAEGRNINAILKHFKIMHQYQEYPMAHTISEPTFRDLLTWLQKQLKP